MRKIGQIIYSLNSENKINKEANIFNDKQVYRLGIQAPPGTKFTLNYYGDQTEIPEIEINQYGIYELDLKEGLGVITSLVFTKGAFPGTIKIGEEERPKTFYEEFFPSEETSSYTFYNKIYVDYIEEVQQQ